MRIVSLSFSIFILGDSIIASMLNHLRFFFYGLIMTRKIRSWMLEWWLTIWLWGIVSPLTLWRVVMIVPVLFIVLGLGHVMIRIRPIWHTRLVKVMICLVGNIRKRGWCVIWIVGKIAVISHITQEMSKSNKVKQMNKQKEKNLTSVRVNLRPRRLLTS